MVSSAVAGVSLAPSLHRKKKRIISWRAVFRGFLPIVCFLHDVFGACFHEETPGYHRPEEILVAWELRSERWEIRGRGDLQARNCLCFYRTFRLACSALATVYFFFCRPPQLGCLAESEKNKLDIRGHFKVILLWTSSQLYGYKYPA